MTTILNPQQQWNNLDEYRTTQSAPSNGTGWNAQPQTDRHELPLVAPRYSAPQQTASAASMRGSALRTAGPTNEQPVRRGRQVDQGRFWVGSILTAGVAALAGVIGMVIAQDLLKVPLSLASIGLAGAHVGTYGLFAALIALLAAGAFDGMLAFAPRPTVYFSWITGLLVTLAVLLPFTAPVAIASQLALALINLVVGVSIMVLVPVAASNARRQ